MKQSLAIGLWAFFGLFSSASNAAPVCFDNGGAGWPLADNAPTVIMLPLTSQIDASTGILDLNTSLDISHTWVGDLDATLTSPLGTNVLLFDRPGVPASFFGCGQNDMLVTFDDEAASGTNIENICNAAVPTISGTYLVHNGANPLADLDGEQPMGNWTLTINDNAGFDTGTLNQACLDIQHGAVLFDKWVSTNATCVDQLDTESVVQGSSLYYCYTATNVGTEAFTIDPGNATDDQGIDITGLEGAYAAAASITVNQGPFIAGIAPVPLGTTVNIADITVNGNTALFPPAQTLTTNETASATVTLAGPASGIKNLYFQAPDSQNNPTIPQDMNRVALVAQPNPRRVRIRRQDNNRIWAQTPVLQQALDLSAGNVPVVLQMRRNNNNRTRNMRVSLQYDNGGPIVTLGFVDVNVPGTGAAGLSRTVTKSFTFPVPIAAITVPVGARMRVWVDNSPTGGNGRAVFVYPYDQVTGDTSRVELPATTVINVDSITVYDATYPGGLPIASASPGGTIYIRAVVSDPFGSFDIISSTIDILDPSVTPVVTAAAMTEVNDSGAATKTYEYVYTFAGAAPTGSWTLRVTANEGNEGTVSHTAIAPFSVVGTIPNLLITKMSSVANAAPNDPIGYTVIVQNDDAGVATNVLAQDDLNPYTSLALDPFGNGTIFRFTDGVNSSGLPGTGTVTYSQDYGVDLYTYVPVDDGSGHDPNVTNFRIALDGTMNADVANNPSFTIEYQVKVK